MLVDAFDDVDFAVVGPVGPDHPERRPGTAGGAGHVGHVGDEEAVVVGFLAGEADRGAALRGDVCGVDADAGIGAVGAGDLDEVNEVGGDGGGLVNVGDESVGWVGTCKEGEGGEERVFSEVVYKSVTRRSWCDGESSHGGDRNETECFLEHIGSLCRSDVETVAGVQGESGA